MHKSKILVDNNILDKISWSTKLTDKEKISYLRHIYYLNKSEREELVQLI